MKKRLIIILILLIATPLWAGDVSSIMGKAIASIATICGKAKAAVASWGGGGVPVTGGSCTTETAITCAAAANGGIGIAQYGTSIYWATPFTGNGDTICAVKLPLYKTGSADHTVQAIVYTATGGTPSTDGPSAAHSVASSTVEASTLTPTTYSEAEASPTTLTFSTPFVATNSAYFFLVVYSPDGDQSNTDYATWARTPSCSPESTWFSADGSSWTYSAAAAGIFVFMKQ